MSELNDFIIKEGVLEKYIGAGEEVEIPECITVIGREAFYGCKILKSITIPSSVAKIGFSAFSWCVSLTNITLPSSVENVDDYAFSFCKSLKKIILSNNLKSIGCCAFEGCESLESIIIPKSVTVIGRSVFEESAIQSITFEEPNNWYRTWNFSMWINQTYGWQTGLSKPVKNAQLFKCDKRDFYWYKK